MKPLITVLWLISLISYHSGCAKVHLRRTITVGGVKFTKIISADEEVEELPKELPESAFEIDILMVADYSVFETFKAIAKGNEHSAYSATVDYLLAIFEQVRLIYSQNPIFGHRVLNLNVASTLVVIRPEDCPLYTNGSSENSSTSEGPVRTIDAMKAVKLIQTWLEQHWQWITFHDHAIVVTKFNLLSPKGDPSTQGMAYLSTFCRVAESSSVVEDVGAMTTAVIAAHELAHSLGASHDGPNNGDECSDNNNHLMASLLSGVEDERRFLNSLKLSECSIKKIEESIKSPNGACLRAKSSRNRRLRRTSHMNPKKLPGRSIDKRRQCILAFGSNYGVCKQKQYFRHLDPCRRLWCHNRELNRKAPCETKMYLPLFDGTDCGNGKWCRQGTCVSIDQETETCVDANHKMCTSMSNSNLETFCSSEILRKHCCITCSSREPIRLISPIKDVGVIQ